MTPKARIRVRWADLVTMLCTSVIFALFLLTMTAEATEQLLAH